MNTTEENCEHCGEPLTETNQHGDKVCRRYRVCFLGQKPKDRIVVKADAHLIQMATVDNDCTGNYRCEGHEHRILGMPQETYARQATVIPAEEGATEWLIYVTDSGWCIGDEKMMLALCPNCTDANYTIEREATA